MFATSPGRSQPRTDDGSVTPAHGEDPGGPAATLLAPMSSANHQQGPVDRSTHAAVRSRATGGRWVAASALGLLGLAAGLTACSSGDSALPFVVIPTGFVGANDGSAVVRGNLGVFRASEALQAGGTILNDDGDTDDQVAVAVRFSDRRVQNIGVAPLAIEILGDQVFLLVDENENVELGGTAALEVILMRWNFELAAPVFVDLVDPLSPAPMLAAGTRLWYAVDEDPIAVDGTNLRYIDIEDPTMSVEVDTDGTTLGTVRVQLVDVDSGLVRLAIDETASGGQGSQNGDGDSSDTAVLALVEVGVDPPLVVGTGLAQPAVDAPLEIFQFEEDLRRILCLVSENDQGAQNLNGTAASLPSLCSGTPGLDVDTDDDVVHLLEWQAGEIASTVNTGLAGALRLLFTEDYLVTLARESDIGGGAGCDLTQDGSPDDIVARWAPLVDPTVPVDVDTLYEPIDTDVPGDAFGIEVANPLILAAIDTTIDPGTGPLALPWMANVFPGSSNAWDFTHLDPDADGPIGFNVGIRRMDRARAARVPVELLETAVGQNLNVGCTAQVKDFFTADQDDAIPVWMRYSATFNNSLASGSGFALDPSDGGLVLAFGRAFFRVSEQADGRDWNLDGDSDDFLLFRSPLTSCLPTLTSIVEAGPGDVIVTDSGTGAFFFCSEADAGRDLSGDGVIAGSAVRYFRDF